MLPRTRTSRQYKRECGPKPPHRERDNFTDVFYADQRESFVSNISKNDISMIEEEEYSNFKYVPLLYGVASILSIAFGFVDLYMYSQLTEFPHFFEIIVKQTNFFQIGISMSCLFGMATYYFMELGQRNVFLPERQTNSFFQCFIGILAQFFILSFALIPTLTENVDQLRYNQFVSKFFLGYEDTITLNGYFLLTYLYNVWYIRQISNNLTNQQKASYVYQIKLAFFVLISFVFVICIKKLKNKYAKNLKTSLQFLLDIFVFAIGFFQKGDYILPEIRDEIKEMIWNIFSMVAFVLYLLNIVYLALFYHDLKKMSFQVITNAYDRQVVKRFPNSNGNPIKIF